MMLHGKIASVIPADHDGTDTSFLTDGYRQLRQEIEKASNQGIAYKTVAQLVKLLGARLVFFGEIPMPYCHIKSIAFFER